VENQKMKVKKEYIALILIIIGLSVYLFMRSSSRTLYQMPELDGLGGNSLILKKKDNQWYLEPTGFLADKTKVNAMLNVFEALTLTALVSESKDYNRYDLHAEKRITVKVWQQAALKRNFDIGKAADDLRDKTVLSFKTTDIQQVQIIKDAHSVKLVRSEVPVTPAAAQQQKTETTPAAAVKFEWQNDNGEKGNERNLNRLLATLGDLKCADYINDRQKNAFSAPIYTVKLKGVQDHQLEIFAKLENDDKRYPAVSSDSDYPFWVTDNQVQQFMINPEEMIKTSE
jgi:hypothetical protein